MLGDLPRATAPATRAPLRHDDNLPPPNRPPPDRPRAAGDAVKGGRPADRLRRLGVPGHHPRGLGLRRTGDPGHASPALHLHVIDAGRAAVAVTTTAASSEITRRDPADAPELQGLSHLGLTVTDLDRAIDFWCTVMDFQLVLQDEGYCMVWQPAATLAIGLTAQQGSAVGPFDEHHVGLDHLALAVADVQTLNAWATRLAELSVPHTPITETDAGHHLNVRAPDDIAIELFVIKADFAGDVLGVDIGNGAAGTHH